MPAGAEALSEIGWKARYGNFDCSGGNGSGLGGSFTCENNVDDAEGMVVLVAGRKEANFWLTEENVEKEAGAGIVNRGSAFITAGLLVSVASSVTSSDIN